MSRKAGPWYRRFRGRKNGITGRWYVTIEGTQHPLPVTDRNDEAAAWEAVKTLLGKHLPKSFAIRPEPIAALLAEFLDSIAHRTAAKTRRSYGYCLNHFAARFGSCTVANLDPIALEQCAAKENWSDSHKANYLWVIQAFVRWAGRRDFTLHRPAKESRGAEAIIDEETQRLILRETRGDFHEFCRFLWEVGCRPMEAARLQVADINWASGTVTLKRHKTKRAGKTRVLFLSTAALAILKSQAERYSSGSLFRGQRGEAFSIQAIVCRFMRISTRIGKTVTSYGYRHSFATRALQQGVPDTHVAALLGHASTAVLHKNYSHVAANGRLLREVADKISQKT